MIEKGIEQVCNKFVFDRSLFSNVIQALKKLNSTDTGALMVSIGKKVKNFSLPATGDKTLSLDDFKGKNLVIYFYPKDSTPGCTQEGLDFKDLHAGFKRQNAVVLGISRDSIASHEKFKEKQGFPFDLISDPDETLCRKFDVIREKSLYGRKFMGVERSTFLIDTAGKLRAEWRKVKVKGHAGEVLERVKMLNAG